MSNATSAECGWPFRFVDYYEEVESGADLEREESPRTIPHVTNWAALYLNVVCCTIISLAAALLTYLASKSLTPKETKTLSSLLLVWLAVNSVAYICYDRYGLSGIGQGVPFAISWTPAEFPACYSLGWPFNDHVSFAYGFEQLLVYNTLCSFVVARVLVWLLFCFPKRESSDES